MLHDVFLIFGKLSVICAVLPKVISLVIGLVLLSAKVASTNILVPLKIMGIIRGVHQKAVIKSTKNVKLKSTANQLK